jgi:uncharacterized protein (DUF1810 family)
MSDPHDLARFVNAQDAGDTYSRALRELRAGRKQSHWMWFVYPQIAGLGHSPTSRRYAIGALEEATAYLRHPILGPRLLACTAALNQIDGRSAEQIFGSIDAQKLRSSMTLFLRAEPAEQAFQQILDRFFGGLPDPATDRLL